MYVVYIYAKSKLLATYSGAVLDLLLAYRQILAKCVHVIDKATSLKLRYNLLNSQEHVCQTS